MAKLPERQTFPVTVEVRGRFKNATEAAELVACMLDREMDAGDGQGWNNGRDLSFRVPRRKLKSARFYPGDDWYDPTPDE
jgi:hypothetical protein